MQFHQRICTRVHALQFLQGATHRARLGEQRSVVLPQQIQRSLAQLQQLRAVARATELFLNAFVFAGLKPGAGNFVHLKTQQVQLLRVGFLIHDQRGFLIFERGAASDQFAERRLLLFQATERVENRELPAGMQKRLVVVRTVHVHQPFADRRQHIQRGGRAVDKLAICSTSREGALENELIFLARLQAVFFKIFPQRRRSAGLRPGLFQITAASSRAGGRRSALVDVQSRDIENGFDGTTIAAVADERTVGTFTEDEIERADDDGFARAGLAGDDIAAGLKLKRQVRYEREVFDA